MGVKETVSRHPSVENTLRYFSKLPQSDKDLDQVRHLCADLAANIVNLIPKDSPELSMGLRKLLEAKDCFVRAML